MKSMHHAGNFNLRGKKNATASCGCCVVSDFRESYTEELAEKEIRSASVDCVEDDSLYTMIMDSKEQL